MADCDGGMVFFICEGHPGYMREIRIRQLNAYTLDTVYSDGF